MPAKSHTKKANTLAKARQWQKVRESAEARGASPFLSATTQAENVTIAAITKATPRSEMASQAVTAIAERNSRDWRRRRSRRRRSDSSAAVPSTCVDVGNEPLT